MLELNLVVSAKDFYNTAASQLYIRVSHHDAPNFWSLGKAPPASSYARHAVWMTRVPRETVVVGELGLSAVGHGLAMSTIICATCGR